MSAKTLNSAYFSPDVLDFLLCLLRHDVRFMIVGGEAVIFYGHVRFTGDIDIFYGWDAGNRGRLFGAISEFWAGQVPGLSGAVDLHRGSVIQFGMPPNRIDLMNHIDGVDFEPAWLDRNVVSMRHGEAWIELPYISKDHLLANKRASGRPKDLDDLSFLQQSLDAD